jgi:Domain of unknown function (DUF4349)
MTAPDTLPRELAELGELLREEPPRPDPAWARGLDARAAAGFQRPPRRSLRSRLPRFGVLMPALGVAASLLVVLIVVGLNGGGDRNVSPSTSGSSSVESSGGGASSGAAESASAPRPLPARGSDLRRARLQQVSAALTLAARPRDLDRVADGIIRVTDAAGGYVASSSVTSGADAEGSFQLRIPTARLQRAVADLSRLAHVRSRTQATQDITAQYVSARERLREALREREGLLRALARATTLNQTQSIRARLRIVNRRIAADRMAVGSVRNRARFADVSVTLVADHRAAGSGSGDSHWTPGDALHDAIRVLEVAAGIALVALAIALPLAVLGFLGWLAARAAGRRRRERALDMA